MSFAGHALGLWLVFLLGIAMVAVIVGPFYFFGWGWEGVLLAFAGAYGNGCVVKNLHP